ncbi:MAG: hypothetical protein M3N95_12600 [Actinomycetota bacterium]|nr:hypothetical protein [Actinomycetota bacterium]
MRAVIISLDGFTDPAVGGIDPLHFAPTPWGLCKRGGVARQHPDVN